MKGRFSWRWSLACHAIALVSLLSACQAPERAYDAQQPSAPAVRNIGNFNEALRCMDDMFLTYGKTGHLYHNRGYP